MCTHTDREPCTCHRTRSNVYRPTPHPDTVAEIDKALADVIEDRN